MATQNLNMISIYKEFATIGVASNTVPSSGYVFDISPAANLALGNSTLSSTGNSTVNSASANGYTYLPGGLLYQWGAGVANSTGNTTTWPVPFGTNVYSFSVTGTQANITLSTGNSTALVVTASAGAPTFRWTAIGQ